MTGKKTRFIYIGADSAIKGESKVGLTSRDPKERESETTNHRYRIVHVFPIAVTLEKLKVAEAEIHSMLECNHVRFKHESSGKKSEWFSCSPDIAKAEIESYLQKKYAKKGRLNKRKKKLDKLTLDKLVARDCVNRNYDKTEKHYDYDSIQFRCPECLAITEQVTDMYITCESCGFDVYEYGSLSGITIMLDKYRAANLPDAKQDVLFDIYNLIYFHRVESINKARLQQAKPACISNSKIEDVESSGVIKKSQTYGHKESIRQNTILWIVAVILFIGVVMANSI